MLNWIIRGSLYLALYNKILGTNALEENKHCFEEKKNQSMHGMHRHQAKRKRGCVQDQGTETAYEHVKAYQQHACNIGVICFHGR